MTLSKMSLTNFEKIDAVVETVLHAARIPGAAIAVVARGEMVFARGMATAT